MSAPRPPVVGILCCNEVALRPVQVVASRFVEPLASVAGATVLLVPAVPGAVNPAALGALLDGLLLTGSRSNVAARRYGQASDGGSLDEARDEVALSLAARMIELGKPVFGICRGLQELNVLFGGTLAASIEQGRHHRGSWDDDYDGLFDHHHDVLLAEQSRLRQFTGATRIKVNSVHEQGIDRLGGGLSVEAAACDDGLVEAIYARPCGGDVLAVQWPPEWDFHRSAASRAFFALFGTALRRTQEPVAHGWPAATPPSRADAGWALRGH